MVHDDEAAAIRNGLDDWLELAEEVARHHRQGHVLGADPALVLRGLPPLWRRAMDVRGPADDVVALAGAALVRFDPADDDPLRAPLLDAAAGCLGADLPGLIRRVRPLLPQVPAEQEHRGTDPGGGPADDAAGGVARRPGSGVALAGVVLAAALSVLGSVRAWSPESEPVTAQHRGATLAAEPADVAGPVTAVSWEAPILTVDLRGVRYRYRLEGDADSVAWRDDAGGPTVVVTAGDRRWQVVVPALDGLSATATPR